VFGGLFLDGLEIDVLDRPQLSEYVMDYDDFRNDEWRILSGPDLHPLFQSITASGLDSGTFSFTVNSGSTAAVGVFQTFGAANPRSSPVVSGQLYRATFTLSIGDVADRLHAPTIRLRLHDTNSETASEYEILYTNGIAPPGTDPTTYDAYLIGPDFTGPAPNLALGFDVMAFDTTQRGTINLEKVEVWRGDSPFAPRPEFTISGRSHDFSRVEVGKSAQTSFTIRNIGSRPVKILALGGLPMNGFSLGPSTPLVPFEVPSGGLQSLTIRFAPLQEGATSATLVIEHNDPDQNPTVVFLSGIGGSQSAVDLDFDTRGYLRYPTYSPTTSGITGGTRDETLSGFGDDHNDRLNPVDGIMGLKCYRTVFAFTDPSDAWPGGGTLVRVEGGHSSLSHPASGSGIGCYVKYDGSAGDIEIALTIRDDQDFFGRYEQETTTWKQISGSPEWRHLYWPFATSIINSPDNWGMVAGGGDGVYEGGNPGEDPEFGSVMVRPIPGVTQAGMNIDLRIDDIYTGVKHNPLP
ncbi:MAG: choice-of-anchor D domain-containing protein, partial [bacterium]